MNSCVFISMLAFQVLIAGDCAEGMLFLSDLGYIHRDM
jgi:hypothetical protein